ncbi:MAG: acyltransferase family protein [Deferrisomatales bacterium]|nr:acyltransferase family protein [Deferrisomatales bacterium]
MSNPDASRAARTSTNLATVKGFSTLVIVMGHSGLGIPSFWVVVTVGLLVFTISSGFFTWQRYHGAFSWATFWKRKIVRLFPRLIVINLFLLGWFLLQRYWVMDWLEVKARTTGLVSWHTLISWLGMKGFITWFRVQNMSPYGGGMWFLTMLLLFYALYPVIEPLYRKKIAAVAFTVMGLLLLFWLHTVVLYTHALWLTACGFLVGLCLARTELHLPAAISGGVAVVATGVMLGGHFLFQFDGANFFFILLIALAGLLFCMEINLPLAVNRIGGWLSGVLLEVYLIHPYFRLTPTDMKAVNVVISVVTVLALSSLLAGVADRTIQYCSAFSARRGAVVT